MPQVLSVVHDGVGYVAVVRFLDNPPEAARLSQLVDGMHAGVVHVLWESGLAWFVRPNEERYGAVLDEDWILRYFTGKSPYLNSDPETADRISPSPRNRSEDADNRPTVSASPRISLRGH